METIMLDFTFVIALIFFAPCAICGIGGLVAIVYQIPQSLGMQQAYYQKYTSRKFWWNYSEPLPIKFVATWLAIAIVSGPLAYLAMP